MTLVECLNKIDNDFSLSLMLKMQIFFARIAVLFLLE